MYRYYIDFICPRGTGNVPVSLTNPITTDEDITLIRNKIADDNDWPRDRVFVTGHQPLDN